MKSWHWANFSSVFAVNELNKWALPSDVLHEGEREAKGNIVFLQPIPSIPSTWITVWFLLLLVRLCFHQMDRAVLTLMKKERSWFFPSASASLFLTSCLLAAPCSGCIVQWIRLWVSSNPQKTWMLPCWLRALIWLRERSELTGQRRQGWCGQQPEEAKRSSSFVSRETWNKASSGYRFL